MNLFDILRKLINLKTDVAKNYINYFLHKDVVLLFYFILPKKKIPIYLNVKIYLYWTGL